MVVRQHYLCHGPLTNPRGSPLDTRQDGGILTHVHQRIHILQLAQAAEDQVNIARIDVATVRQCQDAHSAPSTLRNNCTLGSTRSNSQSSSGGIPCVCSDAKRPPGAKARWNILSTSTLSDGWKWSSTFLHKTSEYPWPISWSERRSCC